MSRTHAHSGTHADSVAVVHLGVRFCKEQVTHATIASFDEPIM
jgi:hypothetical protein